MKDLVRGLVLGACALPVVGTLLSLSRGSHWIFRMWDFPRVQIATIAAAGAVALRTRFSRGTAAERALLAADAAVVAWQLYKIHRYTPLMRPTVKRATTNDADNRIVLMMTNVLQTNREYDRLLALVDEVNPDIILAVEIDRPWMAALEPLSERYPYAVPVPLDNLYGMLLLSRLELIDPEVSFLIEDDIPSIRTRVRLRSGVELILHGVHPRPPEPIHDQSSAPRDAELVVVGRAVDAEKENLPTIVAGDLNDVAWSATSELFVRISGLLDPRVGRGFYNSFNAKNALFRYPLDHVFHSTHFKLVRLERLRRIGSDHFPILVELQYEPLAIAEQEEPEQHAGDQEVAQEKVEKVER
ncbi:MAG TPA: endonuclease/exonuclease/phosphatase family protein [Thermoanaerobaculia bacterium]